MRVLVACEFSGVVRRAFRSVGHDAWSCDLLPAEDGDKHHIVGDVLDVMRDGWDGMVAHPPCTRLANSGVRWLHVPPPGKTVEDMWYEFREGVEFYIAIRNAPIRYKAIENPVMHRYARDAIGHIERHIIQPWWFGEPCFKATGFELHGGWKPLVPTNMLTPPKPGTEEHKKWSWVHRASPGPDRWKERSRTLPGVAMAMATQWG